jgi:cytochrome c-type biogenesis protein CcmH
MGITVLILFFLAIIVASCLACYLASDVVILLINRVGLVRTKIVFGGLSVLVVGSSILATWWFISSARQQAQAVIISNPGVLSPATPATTQAGDLNLLLERLETRLKREPDDAQGLALLARTMFELKRFADAAKTYERAATALPNEAAIQIEWADSDYMANDRRWTPVAVAAIARGLSLSPKDPEVLWLAGKERFEQKDFQKAVVHWEALERVVASGTDQARDLRLSLIEARAMRDGKDPAAALAQSGIVVQQLSPAKNNPKGILPTDAIVRELQSTLAAMDQRKAPDKVVMPTANISGVVSLDEKLKLHSAPEDNVFIFARNADSAQTGMPLAVSRHRVSELPVRFDLSDNNAMSPVAKLSSASKVIVTARLSKSGDVLPQAGDLEGASSPVMLGTDNLNIVINRTR